MADSGQGLQHAASGQGPVRGAGELHGQMTETGGGRGGIPEIPFRLLAQQPDAGQHPGHPPGRQETPRQPLDRLHGEIASQRGQTGDPEQIDAGLEGLVGGEGIGQPGHQPFEDARALVPAKRQAQLAAERIGRRPARSQHPLHPDRSAFPFAGADASPLRDGAGEGEIGRQQVEGSAESLVVTGSEARHGLAEHAPGRERGAPGHASQAIRSPLPLSRVHGLDTVHDRSGVPAQRMVRIEDPEAVPVPLDHEPIRQGPFGPEDRGSSAQAVRVHRQRIGPVQVVEVSHQVLPRQGPNDDGGPVSIGPRAHGGGLLVQAAPRELPGALGAGTEEQERQVLRGGVPMLRMPEPVERAAPVPLGQKLPGLRQQIGGGCALRLGPFALSLVAAVLAGCHARLGLGAPPTIRCHDRPSRRFMSGFLLPDLPDGREGAGTEESGRQRRKVKPARTARTRAHGPMRSGRRTASAANAVHLGAPEGSISEIGAR